MALPWGYITQPSYGALLETTGCEKEETKKNDNDKKAEMHESKKKIPSKEAATAEIQPCVQCFQFSVRIFGLKPITDV